MADGVVTITLSVQDAEALRAWQRQKKGAGDLSKALRGTQRATAETASSAQRMGDSFARSAIRAATGLASVSAAVSLVKREFAEMRERGEGAAVQQVQVARAQRAALRNLSYTELTPEQLDTTVKKINTETGADLAVLFDASADVLSARGTLPEKAALGQLASTAKLDPSFAGEEMKRVSGAALDIRKAFGGGAEQALGAILTAQQTARVTSTQEFAQNAVPALVAMKERGDTFRESSALFSTISQQSADETGARSGTAMLQFAKQMVSATATVKEFAGQSVSVTKRMEFLLSGDEQAEKRRRKLVGNLNQSYSDTMAAADEEDDPTAKAKLTGEAKQYFVLIDLLNRGSATRKAYKETLAATPEYEQAGQRFQSTLDAQGRLAGQATAKLEEAGRGALQAVKQSQQEEGLTEKTRTDLTAFLKQIGDFGAPLGNQITREMETGGWLGWTGLTGQIDGWTRQEGSPMARARDVLKTRLDAARASGEADRPENAEIVAAIEQYQQQLADIEALPANRKLFGQRLSPREAKLAATPASELRPAAPRGMKYDSTGRLRAKVLKRAGPTGPAQMGATAAQVAEANARLDDRLRKAASPPKEAVSRPVQQAAAMPAARLKPRTETSVAVARPAVAVEPVAAMRKPTEPQGPPKPGHSRVNVAKSKQGSTLDPDRGAPPVDRERRQAKEADQGQPAKPIESVLAEADRRRKSDADAALKMQEEANALLRTIAERLIPKPTQPSRPSSPPQRPPVTIGGN
jgi:hypothetical protein